MSVFRRTPAPTVSKSARTRPQLSVVRGTGAPPLTTSPFGHATSLARPYSTHRPITAAARQINLRRDSDIEQLQKRLRKGDNWQQEAWEYYDAIGEVKFAFTIVANLLSRVKLYAGHVESPGTVPTEADPETTGGQAAISALARLDSNYGGQPGLMRDAALNFLVAGECYLVQIPAVPGDVDREFESWDIRSVDEVIVDGGQTVRLRTQRLQNNTEYSPPLPPHAYVGRLWRPHPRFSDDADSSMLPLRELCAELLLLNRTYRATARSRLNAGALYLPDGLSVAATPDDYDDEDPENSVDPALFAAPEHPDDSENDFEEALVEAMVTPISDESSASSVVPLIIRGPAELGEKIKQFKFERSFDAALTARADRVLDRIMQGIDVPKDVVTGLSNVKYSNAIQINQDLYKAHIEPLALLICDCLTTAFLRPALISLGIDADEAARFCVWYDPTEVTSQPNKSEDADLGNEKHLVSGKTWRKAHGFTDADAPQPIELAIAMMLEKGSFTPELTEALLTVIAPDVMGAVRIASQASNPAPLPDDVANALGVPPTEPDSEDPASGGAPVPNPNPDPSAPVPDDLQPTQPPLPDVVDPKTMV